MRDSSKLRSITWLACFTFVSFISVSAQTSAAQIRGRVTAIADGDTLTVLDAAKRQHKIRLQGVDAPERSQAFGTRARQHLSDLVFGKDVKVRIDKKDRYGRSVSIVILNGIDINLTMIQAGFAWHYKQYEREQSEEERTAYAEAEENARKAKRGLWADSQPTPPWEYRKAGRGSGVGARSSSSDNINPILSSPPLARANGSPTGAIIGNRRSRIYHLPNCPNYKAVSPQNRVIFKNQEEAARAGFRMARNCPQ